MLPTITVDIWSDLICPWCWIGKRRFEAALAEFPQRDQVRIVHRAFRLAPGLTPQRSLPWLAQKFGSNQQALTMMARVEAEAAKDGLVYHLPDAWTGDTQHLHRLLKFAEAQGVGAEAIERLYRAVFTENDAVFERGTQVRLLGELGLATADVEAVLDGDAYAQAVTDDLRALSGLGQSGVPFFVFDGRQAVSGAQPPAVFGQVLQNVWSSRPTVVAGGSEVCGPDGCALP